MTTHAPSPLRFDDHGLLVDAQARLAEGHASYLVFAQQPDARIDLARWQAHAQRFFGTRLSLTWPKQYGALAPPYDGAHVVVTTKTGVAEMRTVLLRSATAEDAEQAAAAEGGYGLSILARRCPMVVHVELAAPAEDDDAALLVAGILSSVLLGPALSPDRAHIFGAKTLRLMLERRDARA
jgi:hypothetical protein